MNRHLCDTCAHEFRTCCGEPVFGIELYDGGVSCTARTDEVIACDEYKENEPVSAADV